MVGRSTTWGDSPGYPRNEAGQMYQEGEEVSDDQRRVVYVHVVKMKDVETTSSRTNDLAAAGACI